MNKLNSILKSDAVLPLHKKTALNLICTNNYLSEQFQEFFKSFNLTGQQYNVLRILRGQKGIPANLSTIQERMIHKNSNTSRLIDKLIQKRFVERNQCEENRRKIELIITKKGLAILNKIDPELDELETIFFKKLSVDEIETLNNILEKLR
ncbi:MAG: MarR family transcriptional regulator [Flavobacteriaceae bacterium]|nr:MarR family transcriptional regulator [Flavobacteriaceae bacterium]